MNKINNMGENSCNMELEKLNEKNLEQSLILN